MVTQEVKVIISWYGSVAHGLLSYYRCCDNLAVVKSTVNYHLRWSCAHTLAEKFNCSIYQIFGRFTKDLIPEGDKSSPFPINSSVRGLKKSFLTSAKISDALRCQRIYLRTQKLPLLGSVVRGCTETKVQMHHVHKLHRTTKDGRINIRGQGARKRVVGVTAIMAALNAKQIP